MTDPKRQKNIELDDYEADLEKNFLKNTKLDKKQKAKHLSALKQAADNYTKSSIESVRCKPY